MSKEVSSETVADLRASIMEAFEMYRQGEHQKAIERCRGALAMADSRERACGNCQGNTRMRSQNATT